MEPSLRTLIREELHQAYGDWLLNLGAGLLGVTGVALIIFGS